MTQTLCHCGRPVQDAYLCDGCTRALASNLRAVPGFLAELDVAGTRQTALASGGGPDLGDCDHRGDCACGVALPWNVRAVDVRDSFANAVVTWLRMLLEETGLDCGHRTCQDGQQPACWRRAAVARAQARPALWLAANTTSIRLRPWAPQMAADLSERIREDGPVDRALDRPPARRYAGPCGARVTLPDGDTATCEAHLYSTEDEPDVRCRRCKTVHSVTDRAAWRLVAAENQLWTARSIADAITRVTARQLATSTIRWWASQGLLAQRGSKGAAVLYRVGDVIALAVAHPHAERLQHATDSPVVDNALTCTNTASSHCA